MQCKIFYSNGSSYEFLQDKINEWLSTISIKDYTILQSEDGNYNLTVTIFYTELYVEPLTK